MEVWHVRHGERCDEVPRDKAERIVWRNSAVYRQGRWYDPPLTQLGHAQANTVGSSLMSLRINLDRESLHFDRVYTSPLMRAVQTAVGISREFGGLPLQVVPGLCSCTAALRRIGFENAMLMSDADILDKFSGITLIPRDQFAPVSFHGAVDWIAERPRQRVLCVGHREGIKGLAERSVPTPHCCIGVFRVDRESKQYELVDLLTKDLDSLL